MSDRLTFLDTDFIRMRRLAMGYSQRALADKVGVNSSTIKRMEEGLNHRELSLAWLARLADSLEVTLPELLLDGGRQVQESTDEAGEASADGRKLAAALMECEKIVQLDVLAATFGWTHGRTTVGLESFRDSLVGTGLELRYSNGGYAIRAIGEGLSKPETTRLAQSRLDFEGMCLSEARLLRAIIKGDEGIGGEWEQRASNDDRVALYQLLKKGIVERGGERFVLSPRTAYSLGIGDLVTG